MNCCNNLMSNFSYYPHFSILDEKIPHFYCVKCRSHFHKDRTYTADEWFFYVNEETYKDYLRRMSDARETEATDMLESLHAHELINHSNPEK